MSDPREPEDLTPAEQALEHHLELLRSDTPTAPPMMDRRIIHRARWQRTVRQPLLAISQFAAVIRDGLRLLIVPPDHR